MINWYLKVVRDNYVNFNGRARRSEYWYFTLCNVLISIFLAIIGYVLELNFIGDIYSLAVLLPGLAVAVRRLHDVNKSGWFLLIGLIPLIGAIWLIVVLATDGDSGSNQYGEDPKNPYNEVDEIGVEQ
ncbi:DUF805 domain-containing protein [Flavobacterium sp. C4GT6]|uniref:DUF805 domain-containing protein n=1 Tax=Flavobacterium sp. C4GT6 TaxID=3103818 RepID=UPI002ED34C28